MNMNWEEVFGILFSGMLVFMFIVAIGTMLMIGGQK